MSEIQCFVQATKTDFTTLSKTLFNFGLQFKIVCPSYQLLLLLLLLLSNVIDFQISFCY